MSQRIFATAIDAAKSALRNGQDHVVVYGVRLLLEHVRGGEYRVMASTGEIARLVRKGAVIRALVA